MEDSSKLGQRFFIAGLALSVGDLYLQMPDSLGNALFAIGWIVSGLAWAAIPYIIRLI